MSAYFFRAPSRRVLNSRTSRSRLGQGGTQLQRAIEQLTVGGQPLRRVEQERQLSSHHDQACSLEEDVGIVPVLRVRTLQQDGARFQLGVVVVVRIDDFARLLHRR